MPEINAALIDRLLYESEGDALDFKRDQYPFAGASDTAKSELLKDILAMTNSWRRSDGYILIGVDEVKGGKSTVVGIDQDLDDADLQQFVNGKTQSPLDFSYRAAPYGTQRVGVIHIPQQRRPHFLKKGFGKLRQNVVYIRRGTSTAEALPDEIARMGAEDRLPSIPLLSLHVGDAAARSVNDDTVLRVADVHTPNAADIPDYVKPSSHFGPSMARDDFYRELVEYYRIHKGVGAIGFALRNLGQVVAENVTVEFTVPDAAGELLLLTNDEIPGVPKETLFPLGVPPLLAQLGRSSDVAVTRLASEWHITATLGRIRPKETVWTNDRIFLGARSNRKVSLQARILANNLSDPAIAELQVEVQVTKETMSLADALSLYQQRMFFRSEDS